MKLVRLATMGLVAAMVVAPMPAWAAFCTNEGPMAPQTFDNEGKLMTDVELQKSMDRQRLRAAGVPAVTVERWNGCLRAFVEQPDGSKSMEIYDPASLRRLQ
ncbi:hypothetical protein [Devosia sp. SL43]|uniref:hypothetical protein n=1 Tax=Devosia sp. SL43 TaxID=2806348 RepID=UPI001F37F402|nr:hypothetical protein [Devosia sp. SL43]UJW86277.1 hypothetical protein IM737_03110 [Devosia sp. SL43]